MAFFLSNRSRQRLVGVHEDLVRVVDLAITLTEIDFTVLEGVRTIEKQREYVRTGASQTMNSRHITGHAVDLGAYVMGELRWDWPLYYKIATAMKLAAHDLAIPIEWGGDWLEFKDGPHYQLPWSSYPA